MDDNNKYILQVTNLCDHFINVKNEITKNKNKPYCGTIAFQNYSRTSCTSSMYIEKHRVMMESQIKFLSTVVA